MRFRFYSAVLATAVLGLGALSHAANAATVTVTENTTDFTAGTLPSSTFTLTPDPGSTNTLFGVFGSIGSVYRSPFENFATPGSGPTGWDASALTYTSVEGGGSVTYSAPDASQKANFLSILWGSPDKYNTLKFYEGPQGTGALLYSITGGDLSIQTYGHDLVTFLFAGEFFQSIVLTSGQAAFEFTNVEARDPPGSTPLPAALPLFAGGLGLMGYLARRRKKLAANAGMVTA